MYGDNNTRLFTYWTVKRTHFLSVFHQFSCQYIHSAPKLKTSIFFFSHLHLLKLQSDAYQATGCYNLLCSGFIQINSEIAMGASISPVSGFRNSQYDISILVWKVKYKIAPAPPPCPILLCRSQIVVSTCYRFLFQI